MRHLIICILALFLLVPLAGCSSDGGDVQESSQPGPPVRASVQAIRDGQGQLVLEWRFEVAEGWHLYWPGLNDSGFPPSIDLEMPSNWQAEPVRWPVPTRKVLPGDILDHVLEGPVVTLQQVLVTAPAPHAKVRARVRWLACKEACVPGDTTLVFDAITDAVSAKMNADSQVYPEPLPRESFDHHLNGETLVITATGAAGLRFFPYEDCGPFVNLVADGASTGDKLWLRLRPVDGGVGPVRGLLQIQRPDGTLLTGPLEI